MAFAIKAEVVDPRARTFAFTAQKTMYRLGLSSISNSIGKQLTHRAEDDVSPGTELNFKFYRQATDKIVGISDEAAAFLSKRF